MTAFVKLGLGVLLLIFAHVALGSIGAILNREWKLSIFLKGLAKGVSIVAALFAICLAGRLSPELVVIEAEGHSVNLQTAVYLLLIAGFTYYAISALKKLKELLLRKTSQSENKNVEKP